MAIVKMNKFSLLVFERDKDKLLKNIQDFAEVQFIDLQENYEEYTEEGLLKVSENKKISHLESQKAKVKFSIEILQKYGAKFGGFKDIIKEKRIVSYNEFEDLIKDINWKEIYDSIKEKEDKINYLINENSKLQSDIDNLIPWRNLDISTKELDSLKTVKYVLGSAPKALKEKLREEVESKVKENYIEELSEIKNDANYLIIFKNDSIEEINEILKKYSFSKVNLNYDEAPYKLIDKYEKNIKENSLQRGKLIDEIMGYKETIEDLNISYEYYENEIAKIKSNNNFLKTNTMVAIEGWMPEGKKDDLVGVIKTNIGNDYYIKFTEPSEDDDVPILLENNGLAEPFESITSMYSLPKYNEIDPTPLLMPFYLLFFGMMLSDAGYGALMLIVTAVALKILPKDYENRKMIKLFFYLSFPTILWGVLYGSYFTGAINIPPLWLKPEENANLILFVSIAFGLIHVYIGLGIKGYLLIRNGKYLDAFYDVGLWFITLTTVIVYLAGSFANITALQGSLNIIKYIMFAGMIGLILTQGRENKSIGAKLGAGLYGLYGITGYIGDFVSYSRLMALGLATGFIGGAINLIIDFLGGGVKAWIFGPIIFIAGHIFNLLINALGAYVHTSRLQYVEYFGKFYEGGGNSFDPLKYKNKYIKIKTE
ncbi:V-type ATP synthase subunit I [Clostridium peptidivorans]|uniref:V-type ATP synthase subunit I n=1 Tax=Clostridium peptidivorans TaxID=100174 RepID=UPI000BE463E0|nr:V-type ATP synthase subunit I [Clostridium peptidivorans]